MPRRTDKRTCCLLRPSKSVQRTASTALVSIASVSARARVGIARVDQHHISVADDQHLQIGFVGAQYRLQFAEIEPPVDIDIANAGQFGDGFTAGTTDCRSVSSGHRRAQHRPLYRELDQARFLDPRAFDVAISASSSTEQPGAVAVAARQFARQHGLRIGRRYEPGAGWRRRTLMLDRSVLRCVAAAIGEVPP